MLSRFAFYNTTSAPVLPEKNIAYCNRELLNFLFHKASKEGSLEQLVFDLWLRRRLTNGKIHQLYQSTENIASLNEIIFKLIALPYVILLSFVNNCLPIDKQTSHLTKLGELQLDLINNIVKQSSFKQFLTQNSAKKIHAALLSNVKQKNMLPAFTTETIDSFFKEKWIEIQTYGDLDYEVDAAFRNASVPMIQSYRASSTSPMPIRQELGLFRKNSVRVAPMTTPNTPSPILMGFR